LACPPNRPRTQNVLLVHAHTRWPVESQSSLTYTLPARRTIPIIYVPVPKPPQQIPPGFEACNKFRPAFRFIRLGWELLAHTYCTPQPRKSICPRLSRTEVRPCSVRQHLFNSTQHMISMIPSLSLLFGSKPGLLNTPSRSRPPILLLIIALG
jgi:hypothetical protein